MTAGVRQESRTGTQAIIATKPWGAVAFPVELVASSVLGTLMGGQETIEATAGKTSALLGDGAGDRRRGRSDAEHHSPWRTVFRTPSHEFHLSPHHVDLAEPCVRLRHRQAWQQGDGCDSHTSQAG